jgi:hypothetical protein
MTKSSDIAAARYGKSSKATNAARPFDVTFENDTYSITDGDKAFFEQIKEDIRADDFDSFAADVAYPIELYFGGEHRLQPRSTRIQTNAELKKYKSAIFCERLKNAVLNQSADSLFKNWQGRMIGNGELWFDQIQSEGQTNWTYRITAINITIEK